MDWRNLMKQSVTVGAQLLWSGRYGCNNGRYGCTIVMSYIEINKAVSQWLLTFNLCISVTWPLTCAFHTPCTHTPEIIDMHMGMCDKKGYQLQYIPRNMHMVLLCFALLWLCNRSQWIHIKYLSIFIRVALLALGQSLDCHNASEVSLMDMVKSVNV